MKNKKKHPQKQIDPVFETLAILERDRLEPVTNVTIPSDLAVDEAKDWVDYNEK